MSDLWGLLYLVVLAILGVIGIGFLNGLVVLTRWLGNQLSARPGGRKGRKLDDSLAFTVRALAGLGTEAQARTDDLLSLLSQHPDPIHAIRSARLALYRAGVARGASSQPRIGKTSTGDAAARATASVPSHAARALPSSGQSIADRWFDLDNITLLLYLGAGLIVIAAGIFVGSTWDAIGPTARWLLVTATAAAFFLVGQAFVDNSPKLARAGETFRGVGTILLPFVAIAYDAFLLDGRAPIHYWAAAAAILAVIYYGLYRWVAPGRVSAYLAAIAVAVTALLLPEVLDLAPGWRDPALLAAAGGLIAVAWAVDSSSRPLARREGASRMAALSESHLIVGTIVAVVSAASLVIDVDVIRPELPTIVYLALLATGLGLIAIWERSAWPLGAAALVVGVLVHQVGHFAFERAAVLAWFLVLTWDALACLLAVFGAREVSRLARFPLVRDGIIVVYSVAAFAYAAAPIIDHVRARPDGLLVVASAALAALLVEMARQRREPQLLWPAAIVAHVLVLDVLRLAPGEADLHVVPTTIWLVMAGFWLYASLRDRSGWTAPAWSVLFVGEAIWAALYATIDSSHVSAVLAGATLTLAWGAWMLGRREPVGAPAVVLQAAYALIAVWLLVELPAASLPLAWVAAAVAALALGPRVPDGVRSAWDLCSGAALTVAPLAGYVVASLGVPDTAIGVLDLTLSGQIALLFSLLILGGLGWERGRREPLAVSMVQTYFLYSWIMVEGDFSAVQLYSAPLALLFFGLAWLYAEAREPLDALASVILLLPAAAEAGAHDAFGYTALLGLWGLVLLTLGISLERRTLVVGGIIGLLLAALRQLWEVIQLLPPGFVVGAAGLTLMAIAVLLTWKRDAAMDLGRRSSQYWDSLGGTSR